MHWRVQCLNYSYKYFNEKSMISCFSIMIELKPSVILDTLLWNYDWTEAFSYSENSSLHLWFTQVILDALLFNFDCTKAIGYSGYPALQLWSNWSLQLFRIPCSSIMTEMKPSVILDTLLISFDCTKACSSIMTELKPSVILDTLLLNSYDWTEAFSYSGYPALHLWLNLCR